MAINLYHNLKSLNFIQKLIQILFLFFFPHQGLCQDTSTLKEFRNFGSNPGNLKLFVYDPPVKDSCRLPLVVVLHGCGQTAKGVAELTGWNKLAGVNQFLVLYPQQKLLNNPNLCFNWFLNHDIEKGKGECESIFEMISFIKKKYPVDSNRIYITGLSAGAAMSVVMTSTHPELFRYGAIFAGAAYKTATNLKTGFKTLSGRESLSREELVKSVLTQNPDYKGKYPGLIVYHGLNDPLVPYTSAQCLLKQWTGIHRTDTLPDKTETAFMGITDIRRSTYNSLSGQTIFIFYEVDHLGHQLMINPGDKENEGGRLGLFGIDKNFHSTYQTAKEFGILKRN